MLNDLNALISLRVSVYVMLGDQSALISPCVSVYVMLGDQNALITVCVSVYVMLGDQNALITVCVLVYVMLGDQNAIISLRVSVYVMLGDQNALISLLRELDRRGLIDTGDYVVIYVRADPYKKIVNDDDHELLAGEEEYTAFFRCESRAKRFKICQQLLSKLYKYDVEKYAVNVA